MHTMFVCHGFITYASCVAVFLFMPETKGLTLTELTEIWSGGQNKECIHAFCLTVKCLFEFGFQLKICVLCSKK